MKIFTVGYSHLTLDELMGRLADLAVTDVFDVRYNPFSFKRGFSRKFLRAALEENGVTYHHVPKLGTPSSGARRQDSDDG